MRCCSNDWRAISARSVRTNEWLTISVRHVRNNEWRAISVRHVVVDVTSRWARLRGETRVDKGLRGRWRNTPSHLNLTLRGDFRIYMLKVNVPHLSVVLGRDWPWYTWSSTSCSVKCRKWVQCSMQFRNDFSTFKDVNSWIVDVTRGVQKGNTKLSLVELWTTLMCAVLY